MSARSLTIAAGLLAFMPGGCDSHPDSMVLREVVGELLVDEDAFEIGTERDDSPVRVDVLCPSISWRVDGGDFPALLMAPPAVVSFVVPEGLGPVVFRASAGIDHTSADARGGEVSFRVSVASQTVFDERIPVPRDAKARRNAWRHVGGADGIVLASGDRVVLETLGSSDMREGRVVRAGFGRLWLERHTGRRREIATPERPNFVVVVMDTQRRDRVSAYGHERATTPNVDAFAARGTLFEQARASSSWTWPSTASILTGLLPERHGVLDYQSCYLGNALTTLPEVLQREGYTTAAFSGNPLIAVSRNFGQGFEHFHGSTRFEKSDTFVPAAIDWMAEHKAERFFLYLQLVEPHMEYQPSAAARGALMGAVPGDLPPEPVEHYAARLLAGEGRVDGGFEADRVVPVAHQRYINELYDASVRTGDEWFGRVVAAVDELGLKDRTVLVFTSDHGEELFEHELFEHGHSLHTELVSVPLVMAGPGVPRGVRVDAPVSNRHLAPTLARMAGATPGSLSSPDDSVDLLARPDSRAVFFSTRHGWWEGWKDQPIRGVLLDDWVLHHAPTAGEWKAGAATLGGLVRLYAVGADAGELDDVAAAHPEVVERLRGVIDDRWRRDAAARTALPIPAGAATEAMLRHVGYIDGEQNQEDE